MVASLLLIVAFLLAAWLIRDWVLRVHPAALARSARWLGLAALVLAGLWLVMTGKMAGLFAIAAGLAPWIGRAMKAHALWRMVRGWRSRSAPPPPSSPPAVSMSKDEARQVLGVGPNDDVETIRAAHRRLMQANHPDRGGSTWIAARLNQARDVLLG
jgi:DnaJ family protein C protein 19